MPIDWRQPHIAKMPRILDSFNRLISVNGPLPQAVRTFRMEKPILVKTHAVRIHVGNRRHTAAKAETKGYA